MNQNSYSIARRFAEDVLNSETAGEPHRIRAAILLASICIQLGQPQSASGMIRTVDPKAIEADPVLYADYLYQSASVAEALGDSEAACRGFRQAAVLYDSNKNDHHLARIKCRLAAIALERHDYITAHDLAAEALTIAKRGPFAFAEASVLVVLGRTCALQGRFSEAREWLLAAEQQAKRLGNLVLQLESRAFLMDLAHRCGDGQLLKYMRQRVDQGLRSQRIPNALRKQIEGLIFGIEEGKP